MEIEEAKKKLGAKFSSIYDEIMDPVIQFLDINKEAKLLDIGTGEGKMAISLALHGHSIITGEPEDDFSEYAKRNWLNNANKVDVEHLITFKTFNAENLPFNDNEFDGIFMMGALHHVNNIINAINESIRVIRPEGFLCIIEPTTSKIKNLRQKRPYHPDSIDPRQYLKELPVRVINKNNYDAFIFKKIIR